MHLASRALPALFVLLWATGFIGARYAMPYAEPFTFLSARFILTILLLAAIRMALAHRPFDKHAALHASIAGMLMHGVYLGGVFWAIRHGMPAGLSALIVGLQPLLTAVMAGPLLGETVLPRHWFGLAIGFVGVATVLSPKLGLAASGLTGATLAASLISVIAMSAGTIWQKKYVSGLDLVTGTLFQYLGGAVLAIPLALLIETRTVIVSGELIFALAWLVLVLSLGAVFLLMLLIRKGAIAKVASLFYLVPAVTAILAWILFDETLTPVQIAGMVVTTFGVALATTQRGMRARSSR